MHLTQKQIDLLSVIARGNEDGTSCDLDQIVERCAHHPSKQSLQFSLRALINHGLIERQGTERRRNAKRRLIGITPLGQHFAAAHVRSRASIVVSVEEDEFLSSVGAEFGAAASSHS